MSLRGNPTTVLILGGGDGLALREVWKYPSVESVTLVDLDPVMTQLAASHPVLTAINRGSMGDARLTVVNRDAAAFLREDSHLYGVVIIDLPDPDTIDLMHVYAESFYRSVAQHVEHGGVVVTQATSPHFTPRAFICIRKTMQAAGFSTVAYHNQVPTMGEWGWILGMNRDLIDEGALRERVLSLDLSKLETGFLNNDAVISMLHFGKGIFDAEREMAIEINTQANPVLHRYYLDASWGVY
jgi:spermidine synthase